MKEKMKNMTNKQKSTERENIKLLAESEGRWGWKKNNKKAQLDRIILICFHVIFSHSHPQPWCIKLQYKIRLNIKSTKISLQAEKSRETKSIGQKR